MQSEKQAMKNAKREDLISLFVLHCLFFNLCRKPPPQPFPLEYRRREPGERLPTAPPPDSITASLIQGKNHE
jgi:hypothetical protein